MELDIDRAGNTLKYIVNGVVQATQKNGILTDSHRDGKTAKKRYFLSA